MKEPIQIIARGNILTAFHLHRIAVPISQDFNEGREKVAHSFSKLLNISMLIGCSFISVDRNSLIYDAAFQIQFLAKGFHDQLL